MTRAFRRAAGLSAVLAFALFPQIGNCAPAQDSVTILTTSDPALGRYSATSGGQITLDASSGSVTVNANAKRLGAVTTVATPTIEVVCGIDQQTPCNNPTYIDVTVSTSTSGALTVASISRDAGTVNRGTATFSGSTSATGQTLSFRITFTKGTPNQKVTLKLGFTVQTTGVSGNYTIPYSVSIARGI